MNMNSEDEDYGLDAQQEEKEHSQNISGNTDMFENMRTSTTHDNSTGLDDISHRTANGMKPVRKSYTFEFKLAVVKHKLANRQSTREVGQRFGVSERCVRRWCQQREIIDQTVEKDRSAEQERLNRITTNTHQPYDNDITTNKRHSGDNQTLGNPEKRRKVIGSISVLDYSTSALESHVKSEIISDSTSATESHVKSEINSDSTSATESRSQLMSDIISDHTSATESHRQVMSDSNSDSTSATVTHVKSELISDSTSAIVSHRQVTSDIISNGTSATVSHRQVMSDINSDSTSATVSHRQVTSDIISDSTSATESHNQVMSDINSDIRHESDQDISDNSAWVRDMSHTTPSPLPRRRYHSPLFKARAARNVLLAGASYKDTAEEFGVHKRLVRRWCGEEGVRQAVYTGKDPTQAYPQFITKAVTSDIDPVTTSGGHDTDDIKSCIMSDSTEVSHDTADITSDNTADTEDSLDTRFTYSDAFKVQVAQLVLVDGQSYQDAAEIFGVSVRCVKLWCDDEEIRTCLHCEEPSRDDTHISSEVKSEPRQVISEDLNIRSDKSGNNNFIPPVGDNILDLHSASNTKRRQYTPEYKTAVVRHLTKHNMSYRQMSRQIGVSERCVRRWCHDGRIQVPFSEKAESISDLRHNTSDISSERQNGTSAVPLDLTTSDTLSYNNRDIYSCDEDSDHTIVSMDMDDISHTTIPRVSSEDDTYIKTKSKRRKRDHPQKAVNRLDEIVDEENMGDIEIQNAYSLHKNVTADDHSFTTDYTELNTHITADRTHVTADSTHAIDLSHTQGLNRDVIRRNLQLLDAVKPVQSLPSPMRGDRGTSGVTSAVSPVRASGSGRRTGSQLLENMVLDWILESRARGQTVTNRKIRDKAREISQTHPRVRAEMSYGAPHRAFRASNGWVCHFVKRYRDRLRGGENKLTLKQETTFT